MPGAIAITSSAPSTPTSPTTASCWSRLAGDELADYEHAPEITPEIYDNLVATGFLRMAPDATWANITGFVADRLEVIADEIDVLGSAVMGLTLKCARCHSHKFDPIPQRDYYRLVAVFKGAYDEYDWLKPDVRPGLGPVSQDVIGGRLLPYVTTAERERGKRTTANSAGDRRAARGARPEAESLAAKLRRRTAGAVARGSARRPAKRCSPRPRQARRSAAVPGREVRDATADRPRGLEGARPRVQEPAEETTRRSRRWKRGDAGAADPGAVGPRRAVADVHLSPRRSAEPRPARRAGRALGADRRQDAVRGEPPGRARSRPAGGWPSPAG